MAFLVMGDILQLVVEACGEAGVGEGLLVHHGERCLVEVVLKMLEL